jgi:hypothetical protein
LTREIRRRRIVEPTLGWLNRLRRLAAMIETSRARVMLELGFLLVRRRTGIIQNAA